MKSSRNGYNIIVLDYNHRIFLQDVCNLALFVRLIKVIVRVLV